MDKAYNIISFCDENTKNSALNWVAYLRNQNIKNYKIYCTDIDSFDFLKDKVNVEYTDKWKIDMTQVSTKRFNWQERFKIITNLVNQGESLICSDLDAFFHKDPIVLFGEYDLVCSTGTTWRPWSDTLGMNICMGFVFYNSTNKTKNILNTLCSKKGVWDDQLRFNRYIFRDITKNNLKKCEHGYELKTHCGANVLLLDQKVCGRPNAMKGESTRGEYITHVESPRTDLNLIDCLKKSGFWII